MHVIAVLPTFRNVPFEVVMLGSAERRKPRLSEMQLFSKYSNLCDHDTSTSLTDGETDGLVVAIITLSA